MISNAYPVENGLEITVQQDEGDMVTIFVPAAAPIYLEEDGMVSSDLLCADKQVRVLIDLSQVDPTAQVIFIEPDKVSGEVTGKDASNKSLAVNGSTVYVQESATILDLRDGQDGVAFEDIEEGNQVVVYGTSDCATGESLPSFLAFTVFLVDD